MAINNTVSAQPGLIPLSPFIGGAQGNGSTNLFSPQKGLVLGGSAAAGTLGVGTQSPSTPTVTGFGAPAKGSASAVSPIVAGSAAQPVTPVVNGTGNTGNGANSGTSNVNSLYAQPGQTYDSYEASQGFPQTGSTNSMGSTGSTNAYGAGGTANNNAQTGGLVVPTGNSNTNLGSVVSGLIQAGSSNPDVDAAKANIQALTDAYADQQGIIGNSPIGLSEQGGEQGLLNQSYATKLSAAQQALSTAQGQQQTQVSALGTAAGAVAPVTQYGALTSPVTGQSISSNGVVSAASSLPASAQSALSVLPSTAQSAILLEAQKVQNNQESAATAQSNLSAYGQAGVTALNAILGPNFNANTNAGASSAQTSNTQTAGTASTQTNAQIYSTQLNNAAQTLQQAQAIQSSGTQLINTMTSLGINPSDPTIANKTINQLATQFSSPAYATFNANIANLQSKVSSLLSAGEIPTSATTAANQIINGSMSVSGLSAAIAQINTEATQLAQSQLSTAQSAYQNLQNGNNGTTNANAPSPYH